MTLLPLILSSPSCHLILQHDAIIGPTLLTKSIPPTAPSAPVLQNPFNLLPHSSCNTASLSPSPILQGSFHPRLPQSRRADAIAASAHLVPPPAPSVLQYECGHRLWPSARPVLAPTRSVLQHERDSCHCSRCRTRSAHSRR